MPVITVHPQYFKNLADNLFTTAPELEEQIWKGVQLLAASDFRRDIIALYGHGADKALEYFFNQYLGVYKHVSTNKQTLLSDSFRLFDETGTFAIRGVQIDFTWAEGIKTAYLYTLATEHGGTTKTLIRSYAW